VTPQIVVPKNPLFGLQALNRCGMTFAEDVEIGIHEPQDESVVNKPLLDFV
jgi:hypothetical protein